MLEFACIHLIKRSSEYAKILNMSDAAHGICSNALITEQLSRHRRIQNTVKHLRWSVLQKE